MSEEQAIEIQHSILRRMSREERLRLACDMSDFARDLCLARIMQQHPEWTRAQGVQELIRTTTSVSVGSRGTHELG